MKKFTIALASILLIMISSCRSGALSEYKADIIPEPREVSLLRGSFIIDSQTIIVSEERTANSVKYLSDYLHKYYNLTLSHGATGSRAIVLSVKEMPQAKQGAYSLDISSDSIRVTGYNEAGVFYGIQTLIQLLPTNLSGNITVPCIKVEDEPLFEYRGMHLDVVRHIFPVEYVKQYIDYLALHKMNYFHWHLTDDQGWRMESKSHPRLNEYGSYRDATIIGVFPGTGVDSTRYGGYYTVEQMKEVVDYAAERYITIVPEIDIPGHSMAILAAYPQFGTQPDRVVKPAITWNIYNRQNNVLAPSEEMFSFLEDVFNEMMDVFPGKYIHSGSDECAHKWWTEDPKTQRFIKEHDLKDEKGLQSYFSKRVNDIIRARGRVAVGWDEVIDHEKVDGIVPMVWRNEQNVIEAVRQGYDVILTPMPYSYFNARQREDEPELTYPMPATLMEKVYSFNPIPDGLTTEQKNQILGGQGCMWTEYYDSPARVEYSVFPRISALSEVYWSNPQNRKWDRFKSKIQTQFERYDLWGIRYCDYEKTRK
ncbi:MAG: beta-N-acetylhexosaminidase [Bacteroidales bacterium]|nr:beta-N-acetylhexosaminidase [Bacteroidales bacterium]MDD4670253.1 beta-N-acetylhexosaminidase [Bacteroidales bacterium]